MSKRAMCIGYRHISIEEYHTPKMHLPMQRTNMMVEEPFGEEQVLDAIMNEYPGWFKRHEICDIEFYFAKQIT